MRDCTFVGRISLAVLALTLAAAGAHLTGVVRRSYRGAVLARLLLEAFTARVGAARSWIP